MKSVDKLLRKNVSESTAHRKSREDNANFVLQNPGLANDLMTMAFDVSDKNHFKACWILEIVLESDLNLIVPRLEEFCNKLPDFTNDSALRSISKICMHCTQRLKKEAAFLSDKQILQITEVCFQWLISEQKVAAKAYAMYAMLETGKRLDWVYPELIPVLQHGFPDHSPAYKSVAKKILSKIR